MPTLRALQQGAGKGLEAVRKAERTRRESLVLCKLTGRDLPWASVSSLVRQGAEMDRLQRLPYAMPTPDSILPRCRGEAQVAGWGLEECPGRGWLVASLTREVGSELSHRPSCWSVNASPTPLAPGASGKLIPESNATDRARKIGRCHHQRPGDRSTGWQCLQQCSVRGWAHSQGWLRVRTQAPTQVWLCTPWAAAGTSEDTAALRSHGTTSGQMVGEEGQLEEPYFRKLPTKPA